jgi:hypothetical protein
MANPDPHALRRELHLLIDRLKDSSLLMLFVEGGLASLSAADRCAESSRESLARFGLN